MPDPVERDAGVSTVFGALMVGLLIVVTGVCLRLGGALLARQQAETAADLGALAGAAAVMRGAEVACARVRTVVTANHGRTTSCELDGPDVLVQVQVAVPAFGGSASARARAGPLATP